jgi:transcriptional regulator with XRE-family HTH domain
MRTDKQLAFELRKQGKSYKEIHAELGMSVSTLSNWFHGHDFSEAIKRYLNEQNIIKGTERLRTLHKIRGASLDAHYEQARIEAANDLQKYIHNPLFVAAIASYWGEGDKAKNGQVRLANTDPKMIKLFSDFLTTFCAVPKHKLRGALYIYPNLDEEACKKFWIKETGLQHFHKTMVLPSRHKTRRLPYGTCTILVSNTYLKKKMLFWIDQLPEMVLNMVPSEKK